MILNNDERINEINENLKLIELSDGLTFGTDAYLLASFLPRRSKLKGIELGSGTGVVSFLALSRKKCAHVYGIEIQERFCELSRRNAVLNGFEGAFTPINKNVTDILPSDTDGEVDFAFSNPPYMRVDSGKANELDKKNIARHEVCASIDDFCACAKRVLKHGGSFYVVYRPDRLCDLIFALRSNNLEPKRLIFIHSNTHSSPSLALIQAKKGGKGGLIIDAPIYIYENGTTTYTSRYARIYENCSLEIENE